MKIKFFLSLATLVRKAKGYEGAVMYFMDEGQKFVVINGSSSITIFLNTLLYYHMELNYEPLEHEAEVFT